MADITLNATGPTPESLTGMKSGDIITILNSVGAEVSMSWDPGLFVPNNGTQPASTIGDGQTETYKLGAAAPNAPKNYSYEWGTKRGMKSGTITIGS